MTKLGNDVVMSLHEQHEITTLSRKLSLGRKVRKVFKDRKVFYDRICICSSGPTNKRYMFEALIKKINVQSDKPLPKPINMMT